MKYPCNYDLLREEEMVYIAGGSALDAFNYLFGDWFRDMLLSDIRNATWGSMQQLNVQPVVDTGKKIARANRRENRSFSSAQRLYRSMVF